MRDIKNLIRRQTNYNREFVHVQQIKLMDKNEFEKICLIIIIAQTMKVVGVKRDDGSYIYKKKNWYRI